MAVDSSPPTASGVDQRHGSARSSAARSVGAPCAGSTTSLAVREAPAAPVHLFPGTGRGHFRPYASSRTSHSVSAGRSRQSRPVPRQNPCASPESHPCASPEPIPAIRPCEDGRIRRRGGRGAKECPATPPDGRQRRSPCSNQPATTGPIAQTQSFRSRGRAPLPMFLLPLLKAEGRPLPQLSRSSLWALVVDPSRTQEPLRRMAS